MKSKTQTLMAALALLALVAGPPLLGTSDPDPVAINKLDPLEHTDLNCKDLSLLDGTGFVAKIDYGGYASLGKDLALTNQASQVPRKRAVPNTGSTIYAIDYISGYSRDYGEGRTCLVSGNGDMTYVVPGIGQRPVIQSFL